MAPESLRDAANGRQKKILNTTVVTSRMGHIVTNAASIDPIKIDLLICSLLLPSPFLLQRSVEPVISAMDKEPERGRPVAGVGWCGKRTFLLPKTQADQVPQRSDLLIRVTTASHAFFSF